MFAVSTETSSSWEVRIRRGKARIQTPRRGVLFASYSGHCSADHVSQAMLMLLDQWIAEGLEVVIAVDVRELEGCSQSFGLRWTRWLDANAAHVRGFELLSGYATRDVIATPKRAPIRTHGTALSFEVAVSSYAA